MSLGLTLVTEVVDEGDVKVLEEVVLGEETEELELELITFVVLSDGDVLLGLDAVDVGWSGLLTAAGGTELSEKNGLFHENAINNS